MSIKGHYKNDWSYYYIYLNSKLWCKHLDTLNTYTRKSLSNESVIAHRFIY